MNKSSTSVHESLVGVPWQRMKAERRAALSQHEECERRTEPFHPNLASKPDRWRSVHVTLNFFSQVFQNCFQNNFSLKNNVKVTQYTF